MKDATKELMDDQKKIDFLKTDIRFLKIQLDEGKLIMPAIIANADKEIAPMCITHRATIAYAVMDELDKNVIRERIKNQEKELAKLQAKSLVDFSCKNIQNEEKDNKEKPQ